MYLVETFLFANTFSVWSSLQIVSPPFYLLSIQKDLVWLAYEFLSWWNLHRLHKLVLFIPKKYLKKIFLQISALLILYAFGILPYLLYLIYSMFFLFYHIVLTCFTRILGGIVQLYFTTEDDMVLSNNFYFINCVKFFHVLFKPSNFVTV